MTAKAKRISLYLENGSLDGLINISETDGWDFGGELYACPRENLDDLLADDSMNKHGVYLLLSSSKVYVGQSTDLKQRIKQHQLSKDWWERVVLLTSKHNELNQTYITYLESKLIKKAIERNTLDCENKTQGNDSSISKYERKLLDQYLDEALFVLELIGVKVFSKATKTKDPIIAPPDDKDDENRELRAKSETLLFLNKQGIDIEGFCSYAKLQDKKKTFWINPDVKLLKQEWTMILNDTDQKIIYVLKVPANTFTEEAGKSNSLRTRKDRPYYLDLNIQSTDFLDVSTRLSFKEYIKFKVSY